ncbi:MAG TPA: hypothetical protein VIY72_13675 [Acidimicrobiales bacterium]
MTDMLFVHDIHAVMGERQFEFEESYRDVLGPGSESDGSRLLWYLHAAHGSNDAYHDVVITAFRDWEAWDRHVRRLRYGDLANWWSEASGQCYSSRSTLLVSTDWSPLAGRAFEDLPLGPPDAGDRLYREDTLEGLGVVAALHSRVPEASDDDVVRLVAGFRPALRVDDTVQVLYQVAPGDRFTQAYGSDTGWSDWPGSLTAEVPTGIRGGGRYLHAMTWSPMLKEWS